MKISLGCFSHVFAIALLLFMFAPAAWSATIEAGVAVVDITPTVPGRMEGYFYERLSTGVHDPLKAKAIVMRQGDCETAIVFCDLCMIPASISGQARARAAKKTGISKPNIIVAATHTHTGPSYFGPRREFYRQQVLDKHGHDPYEKELYRDLLVDRIVQAIIEAKAAIQPVKISAGFAREKRLSFNRRFHMKDGSVEFNPGVLNSNIVRAAGPIDPDVGLLLFSRIDDSKPIASLSVFALHLDTVGGTLISADYPHYLANSLKQQYGDKFVSLFGIGTSGDINHIDVSQRKRNSVSKIGGLLAKSVKQKLGELEPIDEPSLAVCSQVAKLPLKEISNQEIDWATNILEQTKTQEVLFLTRVRACAILDVSQYKTDTLSAEVQVVRLGREVALVSLPGEIFVELGIEIKRRSPFAKTVVFELANNSPKYFPTKKACAEGSYETINSWVKPGSSEMLVETAVELLGKLKQ